MDRQFDAMIVALNVNIWIGERLDRHQSDDVTQRAGADADAARVTRVLLPKDLIRPVTKAASAARTTYKETTAPWLSKGQRVLSTAKFMSFIGTMGEHRTKFNVAVRALLEAYAEYYDHDARVRLGSMYDSSDFPEPSEMADRYQMKLTHQPVPDPDAWRLPGDIRAEQRSMLVDNLKRELTDAQQTVREHWESQLLMRTKRLHTSASGDGNMVTTTVTKLHDLAEDIAGALLPARTEVVPIAAAIGRAVRPYRESIEYNPKLRLAGAMERSQVAADLEPSIKLLEELTDG